MHPNPHNQHSPKTEQPLRILILNDYAELGGVEVVIAHTKSLLESHNHTVSILTGDQINPNQTPWGYISSSKSKRALTSTLNTFKPDIIHIHNIYHLLSPAILTTCKRYRDAHNTKVFLTAHDHHLVCPNPSGVAFKSNQRTPTTLPTPPHLFSMLTKKWDHRSHAHSLLRIAQRYWNYTLNKRHLIPDTIITPNDSLAHHITTLGHPKVVTLNNPLPAPISRPKPTEGPLVATIAGRVEPEKGIYELLRDWPTSTPAHINIIGTGKDLPKCQSLAQSLTTTHPNLTITFQGKRTHSQTIESIATSHLLIVPSISPEVAPLVLDEARAANTKVLASNQPALQSTIQTHNLGWTYNHRDPEDLQNTLDHIESLRQNNTLYPNPQSHAPTFKDPHYDALMNLYRS